jgi:cytochrome o ubiquinol oxidase subunit 3
MNHEQLKSDKTSFGFWVYLMTDLVMFAGLFAAYAVLHNNTFGGAAGKDLFNLPFVLFETIILLTSSFTVGLAMLEVEEGNKRTAMIWFLATLVLGLSFLAIEFSEFSRLITDGHTWQKSAFLSSFFTLVGTHGIHITVGIIWLLIMLWQIKVRGLTTSNIRKLNSFSLFWHFLDIVWIFIFSFVYLIGGIK